MSVDKFLDLSPLRDAIALPGGGLDVVGDANWFGLQAAKVQRTLISGLVKNFEFVYEISIKMLKRIFVAL